jgi:pyrroline-5-carboxylate reductase
MLVGFLGAGHIARALAEGWRRPGLAAADHPGLLVFDPDGERAASFGDSFDALACGSVAELVAGSGLVILAMRPADVPAALREGAPVLGRRPVVSLAAFVPLSELRAALPADAHVSRVMPNVAAAVGRGVFLFVPGSLADAEATAVRGLFGLSGIVVDVPEEQFDEATAISGCGPGFTAVFVEALVEAGVQAGLAPDLAADLAAAAVAGSAELIARDGDPAGLRAAIATPGGMTAAGIDVLEDRGLRVIVAAAVAASIEKVKKGR